MGGAGVQGCHTGPRGRGFLLAPRGLHMDRMARL